MTAAPANHDVLLENDRVRILDTRIAPGERTPVHTHEWPGSLCVLTWSEIVRYDPDGNVLFDSRTLDAQPAPGASLWAPARGPHATENVGTTELRAIAVELKPPA
ncbi:hypothetical protein WPS_04820 [Vulcanimicrobium alpinum]|uniref:Uncharacterized protein n=2 Tax=Vulcanimicrobium alpinum TaxID=3016050 RepID=A0AAN1XT17_UNVUL|nr:hypothetical protein WPS_04820 [Vulcanimicrobium alpinum]